MKKQSGKNRGRIIALIVVICAAAAFLIWWFALRRPSGGKEQDVAYVETIASLTGQGETLGLTNRYAGVVEAQESWSVAQNNDATVKEILVKVGDEVKKGDALFTYDIDKYQSDLDQAEIDLEREENELETAKETITQLETEKKKAKSSEQGSYTIQIKDQELTVKQTELDIESKKLEIEKLKNNIEHATVTSEIDGVVKTIRSNETESDAYTDGNDNSLITIMRTGDLRVKGTINEQNIGSLTVGAPLIVHSRTDAEKTWSGTIDKIDTENANSNQNNMYYYGMDSGSGSTSYPFYVSLESSDGLMIGQHVYLELDYGQGDLEERTGLWLPDYMIDLTDESSPFVWADNGGKLEKRAVELGEYDEDMMEYEVVSGLTTEDAIAMPDDRLEEGMTTRPMDEMPEDYYGDDAGFDEADGDMEWNEIDETDGDEIIDATDPGTEEGFQGMEGYQSMDELDMVEDGVHDMTDTIDSDPDVIIDDGTVSESVG